MSVLTWKQSELNSTKCLENPGKYPKEDGLVWDQGYVQDIFYLCPNLLRAHIATLGPIKGFSWVVISCTLLAEWAKLEHEGRSHGTGDSEWSAAEPQKQWRGESISLWQLQKWYICGVCQWPWQWQTELQNQQQNNGEAMASGISADRHQ